VRRLASGTFGAGACGRVFASTVLRVVIVIVVLVVVIVVVVVHVCRRLRGGVCHPCTLAHTLALSASRNSRHLAPALLAPSPGLRRGDDKRDGLRDAPECEFVENMRPCARELQERQVERGRSVGLGGVLSCPAGILATLRSPGTVLRDT